LTATEEGAGHVHAAEEIICNRCDAFDAKNSNDYVLLVAWEKFDIIVAIYA
jgi:hypothetical protein